MIAPWDAARRHRDYWNRMLEREQKLAQNPRPVRPLLRGELRAKVAGLRGGHGGAWVRRSDVLALLEDQ